MNTFSTRSPSPPSLSPYLRPSLQFLVRCREIPKRSGDPPLFLSICCGIASHSRSFLLFFIRPFSLSFTALSTEPLSFIAHTLTINKPQAHSASPFTTKNPPFFPSVLFSFTLSFSLSFSPPFPSALSPPSALHPNHGGAAAVERRAGAGAGDGHRVAAAEERERPQHHLRGLPPQLQPDNGPGRARAAQRH